MTDLLVLVPHSAAQRIRDGGQWGQITYKASDLDGIGAVIAVSHGNAPILPVPLLPKTHFLSSADFVADTGGTGFLPSCIFFGGTSAKYEVD